MQVLSDLTRNGESAYLKVFESAVPIVGKPTASEVVLVYVPSRGITLDQAFCFGKATVAATASTVFTLKNGGTDILTWTFAISGTTATINLIDPDITAGDIITLHCPATPDATLENIGLTIGGTRT